MFFVAFVLSIQIWVVGGICCCWLLLESSAILFSSFLCWVVVLTFYWLDNGELPFCVLLGGWKWNWWWYLLLWVCGICQCLLWWTKQRNKIHCIQLHLLVISIEYYDARNNEYKMQKAQLSLNFDKFIYFIYIYIYIYTHLHIAN